MKTLVFDEDRSRIPKGNSPQIMAALGNLSIALAHKLHKSITTLRFECSRFHKRVIKIIREN
jgi:hypothetical protein